MDKVYMVPYTGLIEEWRVVADKPKTWHLQRELRREPSPDGQGEYVHGESCRLPKDLLGVFPWFASFEEAADKAKPYLEATIGRGEEARAMLDIINGKGKGKGKGKRSQITRKP